MTLGTSQSLTTSGHTADRGRTAAAVVVRDEELPSASIKRRTIFYDCIQKCEDAREPHPVRYTGPWAVDEVDGGGNFNESASVGSTASPLGESVGGDQHVLCSAKDPLRNVLDRYGAKVISSAEGLEHQAGGQHRIGFFGDVFLTRNDSLKSSILLPNERIGWESGRDWKSPFVNQGWRLVDGRDETVSSSVSREELVDRPSDWLDWDGHVLMNGDDRVAAEVELGLNSNTNAEEHVRAQEDEEYVQTKLTDPKLISKVRKLRKDRENLLFLINLLLTWNLIQMLVLFGTLFYAFLCVCSFRQAFGCGEACLLKPRPPRGKSVKKRWWQT
ncbi:hypothetical protein Btru_028197 [Bulinus truncatus]|nr:hypothetical protein Btru_028197 [Bulinus truncatus]